MVTTPLNLSMKLLFDRRHKGLTRQSPNVAFMEKSHVVSNAEGALFLMVPCTLLGNRSNFQWYLPSSIGVRERATDGRFLVQRVHVCAS